MLRVDTLLGFIAPFRIVVRLCYIRKWLRWRTSLSCRIIWLRVVIMPLSIRSIRSRIDGRLRQIRFRDTRGYRY